MKYRATVSFAGSLSMYKGEERELTPSIALPFMKCGYLEEVKKKESKRTNTRSDPKPSAGSGGKSDQ